MTDTGNANLSFTVRSPKQVSGYLVYIIKISAHLPSGGSIKWQIARTPKDISSLHNQFRHALKHHNVNSSWFQRPSTDAEKEQFRSRTQTLLYELVLHPQLRSHPSLLCFLEISASSLSKYYGVKYKEGWLRKLSGGRRRILSDRFKFRVVQWRWFVVRDSSVTYYKYPWDTTPRSVLTVDPEFKVQRERGAGFFRISNHYRSLFVLCKNDLELWDWLRMFEKVYRRNNRRIVHDHESFAPKRAHSPALWCIDGRSTFACIARMILAAKKEIFIAGWWLQPKLNLVRRYNVGTEERQAVTLLELLYAKAVQGVKVSCKSIFNWLRQFLSMPHRFWQVYVLVYKEMAMMMTNESSTAERLLRQHPNIHVLRHPSHVTLRHSSLIWSHHEKFVVVDQSLASLGGIDMCVGRYDQPTYGLSDPPQPIVMKSEHTPPPVLHPFSLASDLPQSQEGGPSSPLPPSLTSPKRQISHSSSASGLPEPENRQLALLDTLRAALSSTTSLFEADDLSLQAPLNVYPRFPLAPVPAYPRVFYNSQEFVNSNIRDSLERGVSPLPRNFAASVRPGASVPCGWLHFFPSALPTHHLHRTATRALEHNLPQGSPQEEEDADRKEDISDSYSTSSSQDKSEDDAEMLEGSSEEKLDKLPKTEAKAQKKYVQDIGEDRKRPKPDATTVDRDVWPKLPWHDIAMVVAGDAAADVAYHFIQRWNHHRIVTGRKDLPPLIPRSTEDQQKESASHTYESVERQGKPWGLVDDKGVDGQRDTDEVKEAEATREPTKRGKSPQPDPGTSEKQAEERPEEVPVSSKKETPEVKAEDKHEGKGKRLNSTLARWWPPDATSTLSLRGGRGIVVEDEGVMPVCSALGCRPSARSKFFIKRRGTVLPRLPLRIRMKIHRERKRFGVRFRTGEEGRGERKECREGGVLMDLPMSIDANSGEALLTFVEKETPLNFQNFLMQWEVKDWEPASEVNCWAAQQDIVASPGPMSPSPAVQPSVEGTEDDVPPLDVLSRTHSSQSIRTIASTSQGNILLPSLTREPGLDDCVAGVSSCDVQILRSVGRWSSGQHTEPSIYNAILHAIEHAKRFVYIENQFFVSGNSHPQVKNAVAECLLNRVSKAVEEGSRFKVFIVITLFPEGCPETNAGMRAARHFEYLTLCRGSGSLIGRFQAKFPDKNPFDYFSFGSMRTAGDVNGQRATEEIYIHSKLTVVDDQVAFIGSANVNERSLRGNRDSEIMAKVTGGPTVKVPLEEGKYWTEVCAFALTLRLRLWCIHLGVPLDTVEEAFNWLRSGHEPSQHHEEDAPMPMAAPSFSSDGTEDAGGEKKAETEGSEEEKSSSDHIGTAEESAACHGSAEQDTTKAPPIISPHRGIAAPFPVVYVSNLEAEEKSLSVVDTIPVLEDSQASVEAGIPPDPRHITIEDLMDPTADKTYFDIWNETAVQNTYWYETWFPGTRKFSLDNNRPAPRHPLWVQNRLPPRGVLVWYPTAFAEQGPLLDFQAKMLNVFWNYNLIV